MLERVYVDLSERGYEIWIGRQLLQRAAEFLEPFGWHHVVVIADQQVASLHGASLRKSLGEQGRVDFLEIPAGESSKSIEQANRLWEALRTVQADRRSIVVALGGGVAGDLAGFVAATYARGLRFVQLPTTLLAQVDSSVGGKTAINLPAAKNMVGAFWQPAVVLIDVGTLETLPEREYRSGLAEVVKYGVILDADFFEFLETNIGEIAARDQRVLTAVIRRSCELKAAVVSGDERETTGLRAVLNYGHTFAHAFEATMGYGELLHGEAVSIGMMCAARVAHRLGRIPQELVDRQQRLLEALSLPTKLTRPVSAEAAVAATERDKKVEAGKLHLVLPNRLGEVERVAGVAREELTRAFLEAGCK